jgi:ABC-2 type transport system permease protein
MVKSLYCVNFVTMWSLCKKEFRQFFSSLTGYMAITVFLLLTGLFLFLFPDTSIFAYGYASLEKFFSLAPWVLLLLIPAITMRTYADEYRSGTFELLQTLPLRAWEVVGGKYLGALAVATLSLIPTLLYAFVVGHLSSAGGMDTGATAGSYIGLFFLASLFTSIGCCFSSLTSNAVVAFLLSAFACFLLYFGFTALSKIPALASGADYYVEMAGVDFHFRSISRGIIDTRDLVYFLTANFFFLWINFQNIQNRTIRS